MPTRRARMLRTCLAILTMASLVSPTATAATTTSSKIHCRCSGSSNCQDDTCLGNICFKAKVNGDVMRGCLPEVSGIQLNCQHNVVMSIETELCYCRTPMCNGGAISLRPGRRATVFRWTTFTTLASVLCVFFVPCL